MDGSPAGVTPSGKARIEPCPDCTGAPGQRCPECNGTGKLLWRACPLCGDLAWDYVNGTDDRGGMACGINCGCRWTADDPGWRVQVVPRSVA